MAAILQMAQRDIIHKAIDTIQQRNDQMMTLLEKGQGILSQAMGERFVRIYEQRRKIWMKIDENRKTIGKLWDIVNTECIMY